jgi:hypothetical protein
MKKEWRYTVLHGTGKPSSRDTCLGRVYVALYRFGLHFARSKTGSASSAQGAEAKIVDVFVAA